MRIPESDYELSIAKAEAHRGMLDVTFEIAGVIGRTIKKSFPVKGEKVWQLRQMLEACGWKIWDEVMQLQLNKLIGLECAGSVAYDCDTPVIWQFFPITKLKQAVEQWPEHLATIEMPRYVM